MIPRFKCVEPIEIFSLAVGKKCNKLTLVHNHTGTSKKPSTQDLRLTKRLGYGAAILNIEILDHIIITEKNGYYSFAEERDL
jgi:DNA repair protein RadC